MLRQKYLLSENFPLFWQNVNSHLPKTEILFTSSSSLASAGLSSSDMLSIFVPGKTISAGINTLISEASTAKDDERQGAEASFASAMKTLTEAATQAVSSKPRLSYNNGYGDFCFGRMTTWNRNHDSHSCGGPHEEFAEENLIAGSSNVPMKEPGSFQRYM